MPIVTPDKLEENPEVRIGPNGIEATRFFYVTELTGPTITRLLQAAQANGVPSYGELHEALRVPAKNIRARFAASSTSKAIVQVDYGTLSPNEQDPDPLAPPVIEIGVTLQPVQTHFDIDDNPITVSYTNTDDPPETDTKIVGVEYLQPMPVVRYQRREPGGALIATILNNVNFYVGTMNISPVFGDPEHTWLCSAIVGISSDGGASYLVDYEFQYKQNTWDAEVVYLDSAGEVPNDASKANENGYKGGIRIYRESEFRNLNLTI